jgi:fructose/tagatose bisphosphate aldolase
MTLATLSEVLQPALRDGYAVAGLVCLGWEDMRAYAMAAQAERAPVILQAGPSCREHTPLPVLGKDDAAPGRECGCARSSSISTTATPSTNAARRWTAASPR